MREMIKYSFLAKIRDFSLVFWPLIFPFALATAMYFSIGQMEEADFETVRAAVVTEQEGEEDVFSDYLSELEKDDSSLISIRQMSEAQAAGALADGEIEGIYYSGDTPSLTVDSSGLPQSILQMILESYLEGKQTQSILQMILESYLEGKQTLEDVARLHPEGVGAAVRQMADYSSATEEVSLGGRTTNTTAQFFYALIGMSCLYGCFIGFRSVMELQANLCTDALSVSGRSWNFRQTYRHLRQDGV